MDITNTYLDRTIPDTATTGELISR